MNLKLKIVSVFIVVIGILLLLLNFIYQPHRNISEEKSFKEFTTLQFLNTFENDSTFLRTYTNKTITIYANSIDLDFENKLGMIDGKIVARFESMGNFKNPIITNVLVKGRLVGYDELLEEFQMDQCEVINKTN